MFTKLYVNFVISFNLFHSHVNVLLWLFEQTNQKFVNLDDININEGLGYEYTGCLEDICIYINININEGLGYEYPSINCRFCCCCRWPPWCRSRAKRAPRSLPAPAFSPLSAAYVWSQTVVYAYRITLPPPARAGLPQLFLCICC